MTSRISIHAPVKGATPPGDAGQPRPGHFNPRTREGCDVSIRALRVCLIHISIHAPVKGATLNAVVQGAVNAGISIHAPVKGATVTLPLSR